MSSTGKHYLTFGPVPSRRLGQSLGINNVTAKYCSYTCIYCQIGPTTEKQILPRAFYGSSRIRDAVASRLCELEKKGQHVDYLTFVPDGEPTLDSELGETIRSLRELKLPIAVISNASLLTRPEVRSALAGADFVSLKIDSVDEASWRRINLPHHELQLDVMLEGIRQFSMNYGGTLVTETMLIAGHNDSSGVLRANADFISSVSPHAAYLSVPTRPTTVKNLHGADEAGLLQAYRIYSSRINRVEMLIEHETGTFIGGGKMRDDLLAITAVHPMREDDVYDLVNSDPASRLELEQMVSDGEIKRIEHEGAWYYLRPIRCVRHHM